MCRRSCSWIVLTLILNMKTIALVTGATSLPNDYDMPLLLDACHEIGLKAEICDWEDPAVNWSGFDGALLRSPWNYVERPAAFLQWCERVTTQTPLFNSLGAARWGLNKRYLADLQLLGVPIVPTGFVESGKDSRRVLREFLSAHPEAKEIVIKPTVGAYSKDVQRFARVLESDAVSYVDQLLGNGHQVILQPYLESIDSNGETNLAYFDGVYSHAIRKSSMLMADGAVKVPTQDLRMARAADAQERAVATAALQAAATHLGLDRPLLYGRVDLIRGNDDQPLVLELEICEPSLNLPFAEGSAMRFAQAIAQRLNH